MTLLTGKVAIVTGSTSGIGKGIAEGLAAAGCTIVLNGFGDAGEIEALRAGMAQTHGVPVSYNGADMTKPDQIADLVASAQADHGSVDILVNNAGIQHTSPIESFPGEKWEAILSINLSSSFYTTKHALPGMLERGWGRVVNIASAHGLVASVEKSAYVAAKHGLVGLTKVTALETAGKGVTCNAICPGWVRTPLVEKQIEAHAEKNGVSVEEAAIALVGGKQPSKTFATPQQIAGTAVFLCSAAADQITGTTISVDGGWTAQ